MEYYQTDSAEVVRLLASDSQQGLSEQEVVAHANKYGSNVLPEVKSRSLSAIFISQFENPLIYLLVGAACIIFVFGSDKLDAFIISGVLLFNAILGTIQEIRTKNIVQSLKRFIKTESVVMRDGEKTVVQDQDLVVGDIIFLKEGERVPADARIIEENNMMVDEAVLTGESRAIKKNAQVIAHASSLGDCTNMLFKGTYVVGGYAKAIITAVGIATEIGKIHVAAEQISMDMPLKKELDHLSYWILVAIIVICGLLFLMGVYMGKPLDELLVMLTALFICVVPEGLPVVFTLVLVTGALRMAQQYVLVKNMQAVEALGRTDIIIIDKTGTLTRNEMIVSGVWTSEMLWHITGKGYQAQGKIYRDGSLIKENISDKNMIEIARACALLNNAEIIYLPKLDLFEIKGDPTEAALFVFSQKINAYVSINESYEKLYEIPFSSSLRYHASFYRVDNEIVAYIIGSPEMIIYRSHVSDKTDKMLDMFLNEGMRVVAVGTKRFSAEQFAIENKDNEDEYKKLLEGDLVFLGLCCLEDSIRPEVTCVIHKAREAGLRIVMATGDHQKTALHVARMVGIYRNGDSYVDGMELSRLSCEQLQKKINKVTVFSRVSAQHKMNIVTLLQQQGALVAMTGDGINDVPSLVKADLGIAMGGIGTEVAKQASDIVLLHDSFATIVDAIEEGRHIFYTLKRVLLYFFSTNVGEVFIVLFAFAYSCMMHIDLPLPITAVQILWLNLVTDGFLDVGLSMEPREPGLLKRALLKKRERLVDGVLFVKMLFMALPMGIGSLAVFLSYYQEDLMYARTMTLITMAMFQWFNVWNCRSATQSVFTIGLFSNKWLIVTTIVVLLLQWCLLYVPAMNYVFKTVPLSTDDWSVVIAVSSSIFFVEELRKYFMKKIVSL